MSTDKKLTGVIQTASTNDDDRMHLVQSNNSRNISFGDLAGKRLTNLEGRADNFEANQYSGVLTYQALADLPGTGVVNTSYKVANDPTPANNGYYAWTGAAYVKDADLATGEIEEGDTIAASGDTVYKGIKPIGDDNSDKFWHEINNSPTVSLANAEFSWVVFSYAQSGYALRLANVTNSTAFSSFSIPYNGTDTELYFTFYFDPDAYLSPAGTQIQLNLYERYIGGTQTATSVNKAYYVTSSTKTVGSDTSDSDGYIKIVDTVTHAGTDYNKAIVKYDLSTLGLTGTKGTLFFRLYVRGELVDHTLYDFYASNNVKFIDKEYYNVVTPTYLDAKNYNLANASMRGDFCSIFLDDLTASDIRDKRKTDTGVCTVKAEPANNYEDTVYSLVDSNLKGYGLRTPAGVRLFFAASTTETMTFGFWLNKTKLSSNDLFITDRSGAIATLDYDNLVKGYRYHVYRNLLDFKVVDETTDSSGDDFIYIQFVTEISANSDRYEFYSDASVQLEVYNVSSFKGDIDINPDVVYPTLYDKFDSNLAGKTVVVLGDSNGGGQYGVYSSTNTPAVKRFAIAGKLLGLKIIDASKGGWAMQSRMTGTLTDAANYSWLYYKTHRDKVLAVNADIYYFNKCTNDSNQGAYTAGLATYGSGSWDDMKNVIDKYSIVKPYLDVDDTTTIVAEGLTVAEYCRKYFTTLGCTGAFIKEISETYPESICVVDTTITSSYYTNYLQGALQSGGASLDNILEIDSNNYVVFPPYLLSDVVNGMPQSFISNGTQTGGTKDTVTPTSTLIDGNNYNLYEFYAYDLYTKVVGVDTITDAENDVIVAACHTYYNTETSTYGRLTPELTDDLVYPLVDSTGYVYNDRKDYLTAVVALTDWFSVPVIDPQNFTGINYWNAKNIASDAAHFNAKGHYYMGKAIASLLNDIGRLSIDEYWNEIDSMNAI